MRDSSTRLGALAGQWDVPEPEELKTRLQPEPDVVCRFYGSGLLSSEREFSEDQSIPEHEVED